RPGHPSEVLAMKHVLRRPFGVLGSLLSSSPRGPRRVVLELTRLEDRVTPAVINVNPSNYLSLVATAQPGDTVSFAAGNYASGLNLDGVHGTAAAWITFT